MRDGAKIAVCSALFALVFAAADPVHADRAAAAGWPIRYCAALYFIAEIPFDTYYRKHARYPVMTVSARSMDYYMDRRRFANHLAADREAPGLATHEERFAWIVTNSYEYWNSLEPIMLAEPCDSDFCEPDKGILAHEFSSCSALVDAYGFGEWMATRKDYSDWEPSKFFPPKDK